MTNALLFVALLSPSADSRAVDMPRMKALGSNGAVLWASADSLVLPSGDLNLAGLPAADAKALRAYLDTPPTNGCILIEGVTADYANAAPPTTLAEVLQKAGFILEGQVTRAIAGFYQGVPGELLQVTVSTKYRDVGPEAPRQVYYMFLPIADFVVGRYHFCKVDSSYPTPPAIGDTVYFAGSPPIGRDRDVLHILYPGQFLFVDGATGTVRAAPSVAGDAATAPRSQAELRRLIEEFSHDVR